MVNKFMEKRKMSTIGQELRLVACLIHTNGRRCMPYSKENFDYNIEMIKKKMVSYSRGRCPLSKKLAVLKINYF